jgi:subtilisin family serine protease
VAAREAPSADLIIASIPSDWTNAFYPTSALIALEWVDSLAARVLHRPYVINLSIGAKNGPKDVFSDEFETQINRLLRNNHARGSDLKGIVVAAGNENYDRRVAAVENSVAQENRRIHTSGGFPGSFVLDVGTSDSCTNVCRVDIWYPVGVACTAWVSVDEGKRYDPPVTQGQTLMQDSIDGRVYLHNEAAVPKYDDTTHMSARWGRLQLDLQDGRSRLRAGRWRVDLAGGPGTWHAYVWSSEPSSTLRALEGSGDDDNCYRIRLGGNVPEVITVGGYNHWDFTGFDVSPDEATHYEVLFPQDSVTYYSSQGPTLLKTVMKPDVYAPCGLITTALASDLTSEDRKGMYISNDGAYMKEGGTSLAAPFVAALLARMAEKYPDLTHKELKAKLLQSCDQRPLNAGQYIECISGRAFQNYFVNEKKALGGK